MKKKSDGSAETKASALMSAALRHVRDAEYLLDHAPQPSPDQAWHLAGFGPECARKALLHERWLDQIIGHDSEPLALDFALSLDARALRMARGWGVRWPLLADWKPVARYERTGTKDVKRARALVECARESVDLVAFELCTRGELAWSVE